MNTETIDKVIPLPDDAQCLQCGYSLLQLTVARCPECGQTFDPTDYKSYDNPLRRQLRRSRFGTGVPIFTAILGAVAAANVMQGIFDSESYFLIPAGFCYGVLVYCPLKMALDQMPLRQMVRERRRFRLAVKCSIPLTVLASITVWHCVHGYGARIGWSAITYTDKNGMCGEHVYVPSRVRLTEHLSYYPR